MVGAVVSETEEQMNRQVVRNPFPFTHNKISSTHLPELRAHLVAALARLDVNDLRRAGGKKGVQLAFEEMRTCARGNTFVTPTNLARRNSHSLVLCVLVCVCFVRLRFLGSEISL